MRFTDAITAAILVFASANCNADDFDAWQFTQSIPVTKPGLTRLDIPTATLNAARPQLEDLRVISPSGGETPIIVRWPWVGQELLPKILDTFDMRLVDRTTELTFTTNTDEPLKAIELDAAAPRFLKAARIESSSDGATWQTLVANTVIFREPGYGEHLRIKLPSQRCARLRVIIDDQSSPPIAFSRAVLDANMPLPSESPLRATITKREELKNATRLTLALEGKNAFVASLKIGITDSLFSRNVSVFASGDDGLDAANDGIATGTLFRLAADGKTSADLIVPVHRRVFTDKLIVDIDNGDSPPMKIDGIEATQHLPVTVLFHATEAGQWRLICGNALAAAPRYDIESISTKLSADDANRVEAGPLTTNPSYRKPSPLPDVSVNGVDATLADCRFRRPVNISTAGVIAIPLDAIVLSHAQTSLQDLRLVQDGRQIPFIVEFERGGWKSFVEPVVTATPDSKRPGASIWTLKMPVEALPASRLTCIVNTNLFERHVMAWGRTTDSFGNEKRTCLGSATWTRLPGGSSDEFELAVGSLRLPKSFTLETDNGDNPPIEITRMRAYHSTVNLLTKVTSADGAFLYYGNDHIGAPQYDLRLIKTELAAAPRETATLGAEEELKPGPPERPSNSGSPWLWVALAAVVATLLWVVARMLPKTDSGAA